MNDLPERIAMCSHPNGNHEHIPLKPDEPLPATCFADCDCTPVLYVRVVNSTPEPLHEYEGFGPVA
jgi:hypothetical protein